MIAKKYLSLGNDILDRQLVDSNGHRCGRVDDIEVDFPSDETPEVKALLVGTTYWVKYLPKFLRGLLLRIGGTKHVTISYQLIKQIDVVITLTKPASELGLGKGERRAKKFIERIPYS